MPYSVRANSSFAMGLATLQSLYPCTGEYLWDHRNESLRQYLIDNVLGPTGLGDSNITGL